MNEWQNHEGRVKRRERRRLEREEVARHHDAEIY